MSFQDLEAGSPQQQRQSIYSANSRQQQSAYQYNQYNQESSPAVSAGVFQINTAVSSFYCLVNSLGTQRDTLQLRDKLHKTRAHIGELVKDTSAKLKGASETDQIAQVSVVKKIADAKLAKDFQAVLKEFQKAQRLAAERETAYTPFVPQEVLPSRHEVLLSDNEIAFNEAIIEEREQGIQEIQEQISEVNEIVKDLAVSMIKEL